MTKQEERILKALKIILEQGYILDGLMVAFHKIDKDGIVCGTKTVSFDIATTLRLIEEALIQKEVQAEWREMIAKKEIMSRQSIDIPIGDETNKKNKHSYVG